VPPALPDAVLGELSAPFDRDPGGDGDPAETSGNCDAKI
jgi:hypothetical protein